MRWLLPPGWLRHKIETEPDDECYDAGIMHPEIQSDQGLIDFMRTHLESQSNVFSGKDTERKG